MQKVTFLAILFFISFGLDIQSIGSLCKSTATYSITSFIVSPYPPMGCALQTITMNGIFTEKACTSLIHVQETYNSDRNYSQNVIDKGCYNAGDKKEYYFNVSPFQCVKGDYLFQLTLINNSTGASMSCWQYAYTLK